MFNDYNVNTICDNFILLINGLKQDDLYNLCIKMQEYYKDKSPNLDLTIADCYKITQNIKKLNIDNKIIIMELAIKCLNNNIYLGKKTILNGEINTSKWLTHSIKCSMIAYNLACKLNINPYKAASIALLHDYGKKYSNSISHITIGFKELIKHEKYREAFGSLIHEFLYGDKYFNEQILNESIVYFLNNHKYDIYDYILNISNLISECDDDVSLYNKINEILERKNYYYINKKNYILNLINTLNIYMYESGYIKTNKNNLNSEMSYDEVINIFKSTTSLFYDCYNMMENYNMLEKKYEKKIV